MKTVIIILCLLMGSVVYADPFETDTFWCSTVALEGYPLDWVCCLKSRELKAITVDFPVDSSDTLLKMEDLYPDPMSLTFAESGRKFADFSFSEQTITIYLKSIMEEGYRLIVED